MSAPDATSARLGPLLALSLGLFAVGVQVHELFATIGGWLTVVFAGSVVARRPDWRGELAAWWPLGAYVGWSLLGPLFFSAPPTGSGVARVMDALFLPATAWAVAALPERALHRVGLVASAALIVSCAVAGAQFLGLWPSREAFSGLEALHLSFDRVYEPVPGNEQRFMGGGLLLHRLRFANVTGALTVLAAAGALRLEQRRQWLAVVAVVGLVSVSVFPHARAATVSLVLALLVVAGVGAARRRLALAVGGAIVLVAGLVVALVPSVRTRFSAGLEGDAASDRSLLLGAGVRALQQEPLAGVGLGRFKPVNWVSPEAPESVRTHQGKSHDQFLTIAAEAGVPALALFLAVLALVAASAVKRLPASTGALGVLVFFVSLSALHDPLFHPESSMALFGALGAGLGLSRRAKEAP